MPGLTIGWDYLTGYYRATDPASRERAEWPPHPGRVYMALAAAWFETGEDENEGEALLWLEKLSDLEKPNDPEMILPKREAISHREVVTVYVPVNDTGNPYDWPDKKKKATIHPNLPSVSIGRLRQARTFPTVWIGDAPCFLHWHQAPGVEAHRTALGRLCGKVTRIGHSSSLVRMWLAEEPRSQGESETWVPDEGLAQCQTRRVSQGTLSLLERQFNRRGREEHERLSEAIGKLKATKVKGKGAAERKAEITKEINDLTERQKAIDNRAPIRPKLGLWTGYRCRGKEPPAAAKHTAFDSDLLIFKREEGPHLPLSSTLIVTQALRGAVMKNCKQPPPSWVSGHLGNREPLRDGKQHLGFIPLPDVSNDYADGHLLGVALAFPDWVPRQERGQVLGPMLLDASGEAKPIRLQMGHVGVWIVVKRDWTESRKALKPETWTAHPLGCDTWASVAPVVLDGFPKNDFHKDRSSWSKEVEEMLARACVRIGLPQPKAIDFGTTSWHLGSPRASVKHRPLRGHPDRADRSTPLGDGFPPYPAKPTTGIRPQFHVWLQFAEPIVGPVLLGAGRFLGYGLCKPLKGGHNR
jgi:CRISPR-associated protein Csb2